MESPATIPAPSPDRAPASSDWYGAATGHVVAFLGQLKRVPVQAWHYAAQSDPHIEGGEASPDDTAWGAANAAFDTDADRAARARLRDAMETMPHAARRIRRRIDHELAALEGIVSATAVTCMRRAARLAACAVAARPLLSADDFARLYRPFEALIPLHRLAGR
jgi:hypothetical protein